MSVRPTFNNVIAVVALVVALTGSAAAASLATQPVNSSDLHFATHESEKKVVITPGQSKPTALDSIHFTTPRRSSSAVNGGWEVTNNSSETVTVALIVGMNRMPEKYTIHQTVPAGATAQVAGVLNCNGIPAGKNIMTVSALVPNLGDGNVTVGFRTVDVTVWNPSKLSYPDPQD